MGLRERTVFVHDGQQVIDKVIEILESDFLGDRPIHAICTDF